MIGILKFKLPEEKEDFELAQKAAKFYSATLDFDGWLRQEIKYKKLTEQQHIIYETVRQAFLNEFQDLL